MTQREIDLLDLLDGVINANERLTKKGFAVRAGYRSAPGVAFRAYPNLRTALETYVNGWRGQGTLQPPSREAERERMLAEREQQVVTLREAVDRARAANRALEKRLATSETARLAAVRESWQARVMVTALVRKVLIRNPNARTDMAIELEKALVDALQEVGVEATPAGGGARVLPWRQEGA